MERDIAILREVAQHRFLRSNHISELVGGSHKKVLERLTTLYHAGYLDRPRAQIEYHVRGGGSEPMVYALGKQGAALLARHERFQGARLNWTSKNKQSGREFILHTLHIAEFRTTLRIACDAHGGIQCHTADQLVSALPETTRNAPKPWSWRVRLQHNGAMHEFGVLPDFVFALVYPDGRRRAFVVECDRGTMPVERSSLAQTSILRKLLAYEACRQQGLHTERFGWKAFRTLIITASVERAINIRTLIRRTPVLKSSPLFLLARDVALTPATILTKFWLDTSDGPHSLI